jgi:hypothetical protein
MTNKKRDELLVGDVFIGIKKKACNDKRRSALLLLLLLLSLLKEKCINLVGYDVVMIM